MKALRRLAENDISIRGITVKIQPDCFMIKVDILLIFYIIFASQGLRSALLIFTLGIVRRIFVIPVHCHLLDFDSYAPYNDVIFSQSTRGFHFLSFECPEN
jgi:hypothetical protein